MKKIYFIILVAVLAITFGCEINAQNQSIAVTSTENNYIFKAEYPKHKTNEVVAYIERSVKQNDFFSNAKGIKYDDVVLADGSKFHLITEPGYIKIDFKKQNNSETCYHKMIDLCMGVKEVLK